MNTYTLFGDDPWHINRTKIIEGDNMDELTLDFDESEDAKVDQKVREVDLETLETICAVFNAPKAIMEALGRIKSQPVNLY